ncbi:ABC-type transport auxiliary lipoprotein family protein [Dechloromonas denitrificans]|jgi:cholesterol transport system auxiliary component|uniref:ABC-type transport auxiliary lipoprotein family protein n=1 Tax=Dechloromonas denitrificans TaxID=281362 RepID=UPI001CF8F08E|nr:ABC-type transport auxiliary lipoprotein family protein [Dechloromonas denitrificans]UCV05130.1 membrane integrity-associated transporter subunit PqiC [Dechloromonas denitrificans]
MTRPSYSRLCQGAAAGLLLAMLGACSILDTAGDAQPSFYTLDGAPRASPAAAPRATTAPTLIVNPPHAAAGFDSHRIIYVREPHQLEYFANSEWADTPARMIAPLIVAALEQSGAFRAVVPTPSTASGDLRLDVEIVRLQHEFDVSPSRVRFTLRAYLVDTVSRQVLAWREFDQSIAAAQDNPYAGIMAANGAVQKVLDQLAAFSAEAARNWQRIEARPMTAN